MILGFSVPFALLMGEGALADSTVDYNVTVAPSLNLTLTGDNPINLNLNPNTKTSDSKSVTLSVSTNNITGYNLTMSTTGNDTNLNRNATADSVNATIPTLSSGSYATPSAFPDNTWGYKQDSGDFIPYVSGAEIKNTSTAVDGDTTTLAFGAKINYDQPSGVYSTTINFTAVANPQIPYLYNTVAAMSKGTQTAADLQATITVPTSADYTQDTSNSGVYEYNAAVFGAATDASNDHKIYYYRGVLENSTASYGSNGSAVTYPNYVKLGNTCWRIVRTTGSGGVKLIYNGAYGATTSGSCANATTNAQLSSMVDYNGTTSNYRQAVRVGYTYNSTYASNSSTNRQVSLLYGTNSSFSSNTTSSTMKTATENWYNSNIKNTYESHLESDAGYCVDRSIYNSSDVLLPETTSILQYSSGSVSYDFGAKVRNYTTLQSPSLACGVYDDGTTSVDRSVVDVYTASGSSTGNSQLGGRVALLTADETSFAGSGSSTAANGSTYHTKSFLYTGQTFWLMSPYGLRASNGYSDVCVLYNTGALDFYNVSYTSGGTRPVISLSRDTYIVTGSGTATDPWQVDW